MGKLKRLRKSIVVDSDSEDDFAVPGIESTSSSQDETPAKSKPKTKAKAKSKSKPQRKTARQALTKGQSALKAELADLLGEDEEEEVDDSPSEDNYGGSSSGESSECESMDDLVRTSSEEESEDEGPTKGKILQLTAKRKVRIPNEAEQEAQRRMKALAKLKDRRMSKSRDLSSDDESEEMEDNDSSDGGGRSRTTRSKNKKPSSRSEQPSPKGKGRLRRKLRTTAAIDVDMLQEAERGHALSDSSDSSKSTNSPSQSPPADIQIPLGDTGIVVPSLLARHLQHHQIDGIKFMHQSVVVDGKGCVLAHCMGLGKTLQAVTLISTLLATPVEWEKEAEEKEEDMNLKKEEEKAVQLQKEEGAKQMNVVELREELRKRGVDVTRVKKKELAKMLEQRWKDEASERKRSVSGKNGETDDGSVTVLDEEDNANGGIGDDQLDVFGNKKGRPRTVLVVCPVNVLLNWESEFDKWLGDRAPLVYSLQSAGNSNGKRADILEQWHQTGGVMICGYDQYRNLTVPKRVQNTSHRRTFQRRLVTPGPTLLICDEGHILRNAQSGLSKALNDIRCRRRVVLTGTPLQNNLSEYHCMIDFVRPGLLGSRFAFQRDFVTVIENGQCEDSTAHDVRLMKQRAHVLHGLLRVCVHRADLKVLERYLPPKHEYALKVRMSPLQAQLYWKYLYSSGLVVETEVGGGGNVVRAAAPQAKLFEAYTHLAKIWTHPGVLKMERVDMGRTAASREVKAYDSIDDFVCESSDEDWSDDEKAAANFDKNAMKGKGRKRKSSGKGQKKQSGVSSEHWPNDKAEKISSNPGGDSSDKENQPKWWAEIMASIGDNIEAPELSGKMLVMLQILKEAAALKEKILLFSQSLMVLELVERVLESGNDDGRKQRWKLGRDYFRLDGSTGSKTRQGWVERFNDRRNRRARLFLISTKAGGLGVNLSTASRIIIFDAAWNPSVDTQAVFRAFRFGQTQKVFVYRLLAAGTMEEKIYHRQVNKNALASRVIDKEQKNRHFKAQELDNLYSFEPDGIEEAESGDDECGGGALIAQDDKVSLGSKKRMAGDRSKKLRNCTDAMPNDPVLVRLLGKMQPKWLLGYVDHDALATGEGETELSTEDQEVAWAEYKAARAQEEAVTALKVATMNGTTDQSSNFAPNQHHVNSAPIVLPPNIMVQAADKKEELISSSNFFRIPKKN